MPSSTPYHNKPRIILHRETTPGRTPGPAPLSPVQSCSSGLRSRSLIFPRCHQIVSKDAGRNQERGREGGVGGVRLHRSAGVAATPSTTALWALGTHSTYQGQGRPRGVNDAFPRLPVRPSVRPSAYADATILLAAFLPIYCTHAGALGEIKYTNMKEMLEVIHGSEPMAALLFI